VDQRFGELRQDMTERFNGVERTLTDIRADIRQLRQWLVGFAIVIVGAIVVALLKGEIFK
jgi:hypothetical protein